MSLPLHIRQYLDAIIRGWVSLVSGSVGVVLLVLVVFFSDRYTVLRDNKTTFVWAAFVCLLIAGFAAWRKERVRWEQVTGEGLAKTLLPSTPDELVKVFEGRTTVQGEQLAKAYEGKWMELSGVVGDVKEDEVDLERRGSAGVYLEFDKKWRNTLAALRRGDPIKVQGQIRYVYTNHMRLHHCELMDVSGVSDLEHTDLSATD